MGGVRNAPAEQTNPQRVAALTDKHKMHKQQTRIWKTKVQDQKP